MILVLAGDSKAVGSHSSLSNSLTQQSELDRAEQIEKSVEKLYGENKYDEAIPLAKQALAIRIKILGANNLKVADSLHSLAVLYDAKGDYTQAKSLYLQALKIKQQVLGPTNLQVASVLNDIATLYLSQGNLDRAETLLQRVLIIRESKLGREHLDVAYTLFYLANLYQKKANYLKAEPLFQRALSIFEKVEGPTQPNAAAVLNSLALLYRDKGDFGRAEEYFKRVISIYEKVPGPESREVATALANLGIVYYENNDYVRAEPLFKRSLEISEKVLGAEHLEVASSLNSLAALYYEKGDFDLAKPLYQRSLLIRQKLLGSKHTLVAIALNNIAKLHQAQGDYTQAKELLEQSLKIYEDALGLQHPEIASSLFNLAGLYQVEGNLERAISYQSRANDITEYNLKLTLYTGSEEQKRLYINTIARETSATISLHALRAPNNPQAANLASLTILRRKGRVLDAMANFIYTLRRRLKTKDARLLTQLSGAYSRLSNLVLNTPDNLDPSGRDVAINRLKEEVSLLEAAIGLRDAEFRAIAPEVTLGRVKSAIPTDGALIEFVSYRPYDAKAKVGEKFGAPRYVAYILFHEGMTRWIELGDAASLDKEITALRDALRDPRRTDFRQLARSVDKRVMQPIRGLLGNTRHLFISPDASLNLIPFEALVDEHNNLLVQHYTFTYLTSGRDLLRVGSSLPSRQPPVVIANPRFDVDNNAFNRVPQRAQTSMARTQIKSFNEKFEPLDATLEEASEFKRIFITANILTDNKATESSLKRLHGPRILHIATHGYFLPNQTQQNTSSTSSAVIENPLVRSGLAMAGANELRGGAGEDGILTALEASSLDLWGTKLVVLSACDTGIGDTRNGEGVYGLRRSLVLAGAASQIITLWKVEDESTRVFMVKYYNRLKQEEGRSEAIRQVQLEMIRSDAHNHPYFWASFIHSGDWGKLGNALPIVKRSRSSPLKR